MCACECALANLSHHVIGQRNSKPPAHHRDVSMFVWVLVLACVRVHVRACGCVFGCKCMSVRACVGMFACVHVHICESLPECVVQYVYVRV